MCIWRIPFLENKFSKSMKSASYQYFCAESLEYCKKGYFSISCSISNPIIENFGCTIHSARSGLLQVLPTPSDFFINPSDSLRILQIFYKSFRFFINPSYSLQILQILYKSFRSFTNPSDSLQILHVLP